MSSKALKTIIAVILTMALLSASLAANNSQQSIKIELVVDAAGVYSVYCTAYLDGERACSGGAADLDGNALKEGRVLEYEIMPFLLGDEADLSAFSIDFSAFDGESQYELGRTNIVAFPAEYGQTYRIHLTELDGEYFAVPEWDELEDSREKFTVEIGGDVLPQEVDWSYIQADYFVGGEQFGFIYTCANEGSDVISLDFFREDLESFSDSPDFAPDLDAFGLDLYLSYSDFKGDKAVEQAMFGNTGENVFLTSISFAAEYGRTYKYTLTGNTADGYMLEAAD